MTEPSKLSWWKRLQVSAVFYPTLLYNVVLGKWLRVRPWWNRIDDSVVLGALPFSQDAERLYAEENVRGVINTCMEYPGPQRVYDRLGVEQLWIPTVDFTHPSLESVRKGVEFIARFAARGESVYVHCKAGRARSATIAACWLMQSHRISPEEAQAVMLQHRPHVNPRIAQRPVVRQFAQWLAEPDGQAEPEATTDESPSPPDAPAA